MGIVDLSKDLSMTLEYISMSPAGFKPNAPSDRMFYLEMAESISDVHLTHMLAEGISLDDAMNIITTPKVYQVFLDEANGVGQRNKTSEALDAIFTTDSVSGWLDACDRIRLNDDIPALIHGAAWLDGVYQYIDRPFDKEDYDLVNNKWSRFSQVDIPVSKACFYVQDLVSWDQFDVGEGFLQEETKYAINGFADSFVNSFDPDELVLTRDSLKKMLEGKEKMPPLVEKLTALNNESEYKAFQLDYANSVGEVRTAQKKKTLSRAKQMSASADTNFTLEQEFQR